MVALAVTSVEAAAARALAALGIGAVAGAAEDVRRKQQEADKAKSSPVAGTQAQTKERTKCEDCPPDCGEPVNRTFLFRKPWVDYQARITGMPNGPTFITEWVFAGVEFDGFVSGQCLLQEAKAGYDQFFDEHGEFRYDFMEKIFIRMTFQATGQDAVAVPKPRVQLRWYFQEPISFGFMKRVLKTAAPDIDVVHQP